MPARKRKSFGYETSDVWFSALPIRKNSVAYVKIAFSVAASLPFPFKYDRVLFSVSVRYTVWQRQRRYGTAVWTRITETDTNERIRNAGNHALNVINVRNVYKKSKHAFVMLLTYYRSSSVVWTSVSVRTPDHKLTADHCAGKLPLWGRQLGQLSLLSLRGQ